MCNSWLFNIFSVIYITKSVYKLYVFNLNNRLECGTVSNALAKSVYTKHQIVPLSLTVVSSRPLSLVVAEQWICL